MRKIIFTLFIASSIATFSHAQVRVGPFLGYGDGLGLWGLGVYSEILLNDRVSISPVFTQYFPENFDNAPRRTMWELNGNINYYVIRGDVGYLYGLTGLNFTNIKIRTRMATADEIENDGNLGLNVGLGTMVRITDTILSFAEGKYTVGGYSQWTLIFGVKFQLGDGTLEDDY
ncbi:MAG: hypothetical protein WD824_00220 [Cyclobacteriaceae bacterium]